MSIVKFAEDMTNEDHRLQMYINIHPTTNHQLRLRILLFRVPCSFNIFQELVLYNTLQHFINNAYKFFNYVRLFNIFTFAYEIKLRENKYRGNSQETLMGYLVSVTVSTAQPTELPGASPGGG